MKIGVGTAFTKSADWMFLGANCIETIKQYCDIYGFDCVYEIMDSGDYHPGWIKHLFIQKHYKNYDYFLYLDPDAIIKNFDFNLLELIKENLNQDLFLSRDLSGPCAGVLLLKNSLFVKQYFDKIFSYIDLHKTQSGDQDALVRFIYDNFIECLKKVKFVKPSIFHLTTWGDTTIHNYYWRDAKADPFIFHALGGSFFSKQCVLSYPIVAGDRNSFQHLHSGVGAEIGVYKGEYAETCLANMGPLYLIDDYQYNQDRKDATNTEQILRDAEYNFISKLFKNNPNVKILRKSSIEAVRDFPDGFFDYVYIDADHKYTAVKEDILNWWPKIKTGGILCGHDYINHTDDRSIIEVKRAVDEFVYDNFPLKGFVSNEPLFKSWYIYK